MLISKIFDVLSALPPKADIHAKAEFTVCDAGAISALPPKATLNAFILMSAKGQ
jgi:hypothetical protein